VGVGRELLAQRELDDGLLLVTPKESEDAPKGSRSQESLRPTCARILVESWPHCEAESGLVLRLLFRDERAAKKKT
jgi:hypothetical protein